MFAQAFKSDADDRISVAQHRTAADHSKLTFRPARVCLSVCSAQFQCAKHSVRVRIFLRARTHTHRSEVYLYLFALDNRLKLVCASAIRKGSPKLCARMFGYLTHDDCAHWRHWLWHPRARLDKKLTLLFGRTKERRKDSQSRCSSRKFFRGAEAGESY